MQIQLSETSDNSAAVVGTVVSDVALERWLSSEQIINLFHCICRKPSCCSILDGYDKNYMAFIHKCFQRLRGLLIYVGQSSMIGHFLGHAHDDAYWRRNSVAAFFKTFKKNIQDDGRRRKRIPGVLVGFRMFFPAEYDAQERRNPSRYAYRGEIVQ